MATNLFMPKQGKALTIIPVGMITSNPRQPRQEFDQDELLSLCDSIRRNGILQPLTVRRISDTSFELISGERRLRAAIMAGLLCVPCLELLVDSERSALLSLIENIQRQDLNLFEEAEGIARMMAEWNITQAEAAQRLGMAQSTVANKLRLLRCSATERERILSARLTERHARALLRLKDPERRKPVLEEVIARGLNVAETEKLVERTLNPPPAAHVHRSPLIRDVRLFVNTITRAVDTMRQSGLDARAAKSENDEYIEYRVIIPKRQARKQETGAK